ncbi:MAG: hypothetical protein COT45_00335 [bacterium (Candidatus Stahlbacteria) CG08_land_8_20_14_0_20_40_26]|nr:MAG: hypothetical protein COT45_00335 [bacterium (Candidatus Stahlbacteria) CG08_land_8_20_14_0_20_40_26]
MYYIFIHKNLLAKSPPLWYNRDIKIDASKGSTKTKNIIPNYNIKKKRNQAKIYPFTKVIVGCFI